LQRRPDILGCPVDVLDMAAAVERVADLVDQHGDDAPPALVVTLNPEIIMRCRREPDFAALVRGAAIVLPDGIGVVNALRRRGYAGVGRVAGVDFLTAYATIAAKRRHRVALVGSKRGVARRAARALERVAPGLLVAYAEGADPIPETVYSIAAARPDIVGAAFGAGRQERWLVENLHTMGASVGIGIGGTLDFLAGDVRRAPALVRRAGLEWAWRLARQPGRVRRQWVLPVFWWLERREARAL